MNFAQWIFFRQDKFSSVFVREKNKNFEIFFSCKFGCQMKFGEKIVFPDPDSRVKILAPQVGTDPRKLFVLRLTSGKIRQIWDRIGESLLK